MQQVSLLDVGFTGLIVDKSLSANVETADPQPESREVPEDLKVRVCRSLCCGLQGDVCCHGRIHEQW
jgi:hypothetical protein